ncbi:MAG TPA: hypothetical protein VG425_04710 [Casimicrobiaceae bacterium]|jgi:hypothetical protein|nr:hypothetical protein [Casimicrobiaceae bacterium]
MIAVPRRNNAYPWPWQAVSPAVFACARAERAKTQGLNDLIIFAVMGVSSFASGALIDAAGWGSVNAVVLPFIAVAALATAWLAMLAQTPATPGARPPQRGW